VSSTGPACPLVTGILGADGGQFLHLRGKPTQDKQLALREVHRRIAAVSGAQAVRIAK